MEAKKSPHHEGLSGTNILTVRQNRFESEGIFQIEHNGERFNIMNYSLFGMAIRSAQEIPVDTILDGVRVVCGNQNVTTVSFIVKRSKKVDFGYETGLEVLNGTLPVETILRIKDFNSLVSTLEEKVHYYGKLPEAFKLALHELCTRLENYEKYVKNFSEKEFTNGQEYYESREALIDVVSGQIQIELAQATEKMKLSFVHSQNEDFKPAFAYFREHIGKYLFQSPFTKRSYEKPRGYAGDYIMMNQIYTAENAFANSLFGSCMEKAVQSFGEPSAVRNRSVYLSQKILNKVKQNTKQDLKFLSVACGPAEEVRIALDNLTQKELDRCEFHLLDQDEGALQFAQKSILEHALKQGKKIRLKLVNKGIKEILIMGMGDQRFDMIYSAGLFDYFTDIIATKACKLLFKHVGEDGTLVIGNFNLATTNWFGMLALFDWSLILRSDEDLKRLFKFDNNKVEIESEKENINLFCCISK